MAWMQLGQQFLQYMACYLLRMGQDLVMSYRYKTISLGRLSDADPNIFIFSWSDLYFYSVFSVCTTAFPCANTCNKRKSVSLKDATSIKEVVTFGEVWAPPPPHRAALKRTLMFTQTQKWAEGQLIPRTTKRIFTSFGN